MQWIVYAMLFVNTVDTKIKACNAFNAICQSSRHIHTFLPITFFQPIFNLQKVLENWGWGLFNHFIKYYICRHCRHKTRISNAVNAMYVDTVNTKHIYTFLPITFLIFNQFSIRKKVLESWDWGLFNHTIKYYICQHCRHKTRISNAFNAMYVDTLDTQHIYTFLPITFLIFNQFSICKKFWKAETEGFSTIKYYICQHCWH